MRHPGRLLLVMLAPWLVVAALLLPGCDRDPLAPATPTPAGPATPVAPAAPSAAGDVAGLEVALAQARARLASEQAARAAADRAARLAPIQAACTWAAWLGGLVSLLSGAGLVALIVGAPIPLGRSLLAALAAGGAALAILALSLGESLPAIVRWGPWVLAALAVGTLGWLLWRLAHLARTGWASSTALGEALRQTAPDLHAHVAADLARQQASAGLQGLGRSLRRRFEPAAIAAARTWRETRDPQPHDIPGGQ